MAPPEARRAGVLDGLREPVLAACDAGGRTRAVAAQFSVSESWVRGLKRRRADTGEVAPGRPATAELRSGTGTPTTCRRPSPPTRTGRSYSPDLNPIGPASGKLKATLRRREERTVEGLWAALGESLDWFAPDERRRYLRYAGYGAAQ